MSAEPKGREDKWPSTLAYILAHLEDDLKNDFEPARAKDLAIRAALALAKTAGGAPLYLPRADALARILRNEEIWKKFNSAGSMNYDLLARHFKLCSQQVRKLVNQRVEWERAKRQSDLFSEQC